MSDEKKYTVDDILAEYEHKKPELPENIGSGTTEDADGINNEKSPAVSDTAGKTESTQQEYDNYEDGEEQDISGKGFVSDPLFVPAELFDSAAVSEEPNETEEENEDFETSEEIFADDEENEDIEITEELLEEEVPDVTDDEVIIEAEGSDEADDVRTWAGNGINDEITDIDIPEESDGVSKEDPEEGSEERSEETDPAASSEFYEVSEGSGDVNDKWLIRTAKNIFPVRGDSAGEIIRKIIFLAAIIVFIGAGVMLISTLIQSGLALGEKDKAKDIITTTAASYIDEDGNVVVIAPTEEEKTQHNIDVAAYYKGINPDYVGYLEVEGCDIYEPVVQGEDNDQYLRTNISGGYNKAGTVFMDCRCTFTEEYESPNIVLYGHNQEDGTMFGNLKWYKRGAEFYSQHPTVKFSSGSETGEYLIYGYFVTNAYAKQSSTGEVFHYHDYIETLNDEYTFDWYMQQIQRRNQIVSPVDVEFGDKLLCLSTCSSEFSDSRFVVFARKLREGESAEDHDFSKAYMNPDAERVDWDAIMSGETIPTPETDVIDEIDTAAEPPEVLEIYKTNRKSNSGRGAKSNEVTIVPPPDAETTAASTETESLAP